MNLKPVWCVAYYEDRKSRKKWCVTFRGHKPSKEALSDRTACGWHVSLRIGSEKRLPTCQECLAKLARRRENRPPRKPKIIARQALGTLGNLVVHGIVYRDGLAMLVTQVGRKVTVLGAGPNTYAAIRIARQRHPDIRFSPETPSNTDPPTPGPMDRLKSLSPAERATFVPISDERIDAALAAGAKAVEAAKNPRPAQSIIWNCTYPEEMDATDGACPAWWRAEERISKVWKERYDKLEGRFKSNEEMFRWAKAHKSEVERLNLEVKDMLSLLEEAGALMNRVVKMPADWEKDWGKWRGKVIDLHDRAASHVANPHFCEHANECPQMCPCDRRCYCRTRTCRSPR